MTFRFAPETTGAVTAGRPPWAGVITRPSTILWSSGPRGRAETPERLSQIDQITTRLTTEHGSH